MSRGRVLYVGAFRFPDGDAAAARVLGIGKTLRLMGYEVEYLGWEAAERPQDQDADGVHRFDGFRYRSMAELPGEAAASPLRRTLRFLSTGERTLRWLRSADLTGLKAIVAYHGPAPFLLKLRRLCAERGVALLFDCTEWYAGATLPGGPCGPVAIDNAVRMRMVYPAIGRGIVISSYLERYYRGRGVRTVQIPPTVDLQDVRWAVPEAKLEPGRPLRLVYAGSPGRKDLIATLLGAMAQLGDAGVPVFADVIGPTEAELLAILGSNAALLAKVRGSLRLDGRIAQAEVPARVAAADFSVLVRPVQRSSDAGFSTKLVESLAVGTPVIANATGDIAEYISHGVNGFIVRDPSPQALTDAVLSAARLEPETHTTMRAAARATARTRLNCARFDAYEEDLRTLIEAAA